MRVGILGLMFLIFLTLKLLGTITWSWWWVTAPLWGGFAFFACVFILGIIGLVSIAALSGNKGKKISIKRKFK